MNPMKVECELKAPPREGVGLRPCHEASAGLRRPLGGKLVALKGTAHGDLEEEQPQGLGEEPPGVEICESKDLVGSGGIKTCDEKCIVASNNLKTYLATRNFR